MRDGLIKHIKNSLIKHIDKSCLLAENIADDLLADGIIAPPCKVGDIVWVANKSVGKAFFNKVVCIIFGASRNTNTIVVEYRNTYGETSRREFKWNQFGKQVFFSREEAEAALKGR